MCLEDAHHPRDLAPMLSAFRAVLLQAVGALCSLRFSVVSVVADHASGGANERVIKHACIP
jgi:hypothetical protein